MSGTLRIAEVAQRSGFTPATLRYYENIGLLTPPRRTDAGYRLYDERSLERLRFISRAKQLGCSLDEVAELVSVWDAGRCATVQERLRTTVDTKIAEVHGQITAMTTLAAELGRVAAALSAEPVDGPCDDTCACTTDDRAPSSPGTSVPRASKADTHGSGGAGEEAVACTLDAGAMATRVEEWNALLADRQELLQGVAARRSLDDGLRLEFGPNTDVTEIARLAAAEQGCCRFFDFSLTIDDRGIALEVRAPRDAQPALTALFGAAG